MNFRNLMIVETITCLVFGLLYFLAPQFLVDEYLVDKTGLNSTAKLVDWHYGSLLITAGIMMWVCRNARPSMARFAILFLPVLSNLFIVLISVYALTAGIETNMILTVIVLCGVMGVWAAILLRKEQALVLDADGAAVRTTSRVH